ncbi:MAG TPA: hypothetical protein DIC23_02190 [Planctomycetaceae bacterium]|nr:hypothetical protein [Planctomycetaceae bacterium]
MGKLDGTIVGEEGTSSIGSGATAAFFGGAVLRDSGNAAGAAEISRDGLAVGAGPMSSTSGGGVGVAVSSCWFVDGGALNSGSD